MIVDDDDMTIRAWFTALSRYHCKISENDRRDYDDWYAEIDTLARFWKCHLCGYRKEYMINMAIGIENRRVNICRGCKSACMPE
jgi:hypothetical protein